MFSSFSDILRLPANERAQLAMALWDSLAAEERDAELSLTTEQQTELDRRWEVHLRDPDSAIAWVEVRRRLRGRT
ncbi:MAG: addiction module protein [Candidatus Latescibacterota bacterium]|jgi:putative addiction module component (TIGR02574 family)